MVLPAIALAGGVWPVAPGRSAQFLATHTSNAGTGSLRWAINQAGNCADPDGILFRASLKGSPIPPTGALPPLSDRRDGPNLGRVVCSALMGGALPTEGALALPVTGASARPTNAGGAAIVFGLATPAKLSVTALNVAGRAVATICTNPPAGAGTQRLAWHGRLDAGMTLPKGTYLVRSPARDPGGQQAASLVSLRVGR